VHAANFGLSLNSKMMIDCAQEQEQSFDNKQRRRNSIAALTSIMVFVIVWCSTQMWNCYSDGGKWKISAKHSVCITRICLPIIVTATKVIIIAAATTTATA